MPWGSWVTCEETVNGPDVGPDFTGASNVPLTQPHGFIFEVPAGGESTREPITAAGRFAHEAVAFDPLAGVALPDRGQLRLPVGLLPLPARRAPDAGGGRLGNAGRLQMLAVRGTPNADLAASPARGRHLPGRVGRHRRPRRRRSRTRRARRRRPRTTRPSTTSAARAGPRVRRASPGSRARLRQRHRLLHLDPGRRARRAGPTPTRSRAAATASGRSGPTTRAPGACDSSTSRPAPTTLDFPDNVTTSHRGTLVLCEDSTGDNYLRGLTRRGELFDIALNRLVQQHGRPRGSTTSSPGRRSAPTATPCSSTSRPAGA